jgi:uncharacterized membrane protein HdeD (DUF308 family)
MSTTSSTGRSGAASDLKSRMMSAGLATNWWAVALRGLFAIVFGLIALFLPGVTMLSLVLLFAAYLLVDGVLGIVAAFRAARRGERWVLLAVAGLAGIVTGVLAFLWPGITLLALVLLISASSILSGALTIAAAFALRETHGRKWMFLSGILSALFGAALFVAPLIGAVVLTWWLGAYALVLGITLLVLAFRLRARRHDPTPGLAAAPA